MAFIEHLLHAGWNLTEGLGGLVGFLRRFSGGGGIGSSLGAQGQRGHSGVGTVRIDSCRAVWGNLEKEFCAQGRTCWELGQFLKDSEDLVGWAGGTPSKWAARRQPAAWARMACFSMHSDPGQGVSWGILPLLLVPRMSHRQSSSPSFRAVSH